MTDDEFEKLKEDEKAHLREVRALRQAVRLLERQRSVTRELEEMVSRSRAALEANERLLEEIAMDTAQKEARLDVALEGLEAESSEQRAENREQSTESGEQRVESDEREAEKKGDAPPAGPEQLPEKTLGRMR